MTVCRQHASEQVDDEHRVGGLGLVVVVVVDQDEYYDKEEKRSRGKITQEGFNFQPWVCRDETALHSSLGE